MKVSIITVTLNSEKHLNDCIASVSSQNYQDIEYIIVDGKSTDGTLDIIKDNRQAIAAWISETDRGMYDAINKAIRMATGDIIGILNSDDILADPDVIGKIASAFTDPVVDAVYGDLVYVEENDLSNVYRVWKGKDFKRARFRTGWMPAHPTFYIRRSLVEKYGGYENHYYSAADYEFMARYLYANRLTARYIPSLIVKMRRGGQSNNNLKKRLRANRRDYLAMKKNKIPFPLLVSILKPLSKLHQYTIRNNK